ncbi:MAG: hypothetical protein A3F67_10885 [Verrucomicrobia bacterium RIFCSPHIGHO2_12_FULL_41_10]|nr:MAG: hypothetical protein A3F67_10885 [Verrucomicrobia bacterium RIFCSPHIGHO2_12_FULL_41_10]
MKPQSLEQAMKIITSMQAGIKNLSAQKRELAERNKNQMVLISTLARRVSTAEKEVLSLKERDKLKLVSKRRQHAI